MGIIDRIWDKLKSRTRIYRNRKENVGVDEILRVLLTDEVSVKNLIKTCNRMKEALAKDDYEEYLKLVQSFENELESHLKKEDLIKRLNQFILTWTKLGNLKRNLIK